jgi:hypothetical protein
MQEKASWLIMLYVGTFLIIVGFQGSLGRCIGCILTPAIVVVDTE